MACSVLYCGLFCIMHCNGYGISHTVCMVWYCKCGVLRVLYCVLHCFIAFCVLRLVLYFMYGMVFIVLCVFNFCIVRSCSLSCVVVLSSILCRCLSSLRSLLLCIPWY